MNAPKRPLLLVVSAPSGTGKTTLVRKLVAEHSDAVRSISCTTRPPRGNEERGQDYTYVDEQTFFKLVKEDALVEWAEVHGHHYGTPQKPVEDAVAGGRLMVFDIDVQGGEQIAAKFPEAVTVFLLPPSMEALEARLRGRGTEDEESIARRLLAARREIERGLETYEYALVNEDLDTAYADLVAVVRAERLRRGRLALKSFYAG